MTDYHKTIDGIDTRGVIAPSDIPVEVRDKNYVHTQTVTSNEWIIEHNLGKNPSVECYNYADNNRIIGSIENIDINKLIVRFTIFIRGTAICN